jgi:hypothetical protein
VLGVMLMRGEDAAAAWCLQPAVVAVSNTAVATATSRRRPRTLTGAVSPQRRANLRDGTVRA